ncbi:phosphoribosyltransferase [Granulosicoccus antarcticus]|uniref:Xanthine phosphoribosyltransferase n=1 Tax=Granulosicoccus antarcticus IMCC3135 TaxID=1192854 RepID=A0A2Z2NUE4_9GAMM|nr:phosphoribosyltransferase family protein [Granulosicoccus antarcticus]ASJ75192.1 Xanthine phosphoribosyltransferase [Granulosicoccus antarcticus IMCC3135]
MSTDEKVYISAQQLLEDSLELGRQILASGFRPNYIVGVWRGGTPVGIMVQELLDFYGVETDHISIRTSSYAGIDKRSSSVRVHGLSYLTKKMNAEDSMLIVDDVFDTGLSVKAIIDKMSERARKNLPHDVRVATAYFKPGRNRTNFEPDYCAHKTDDWLVFPHEMAGLSMEEIKISKPHLLPVMNSLEGIATPAKLRK